MFYRDSVPHFYLFNLLNLPTDFQYEEDNSEKMCHDTSLDGNVCRVTW